MSEWLLVLLLVNTVILVLVKRNVTRVEEKEEMLSSRVEYLNHEVKDLVDSVRHGGAKANEQPVQQQPKPEVRAISEKEKPRQTVTPDIKAAIPPPLPVSVETPAVVPEPVPAVQQSAFAESAKEILGKIWRWIIYGDENRREGISTEVAVATTWLIRVGVIVVVVGVIYFLKWSLERDLISPAARVGVSMITGVSLLVFGLKLLGKKYHLLGQGLLGGGLLILYASSFSAGPVYHLFGPSSMIASFALMILVTAAAGIVAVRTDSLLVAVIGIAGGYMTPVLLRTSAPNLPGFYSYILLLSLGIMAIAYYKQWRLLNYLGFVGTYILFFASLDRAYKPDDFAIAISFGTAFLVVHSAIVYLHNIARGNKSTTLEIIHLVANAFLYAWAAYWLINGKYGRPYPAIMSLGLAVFYVAHVLIFLEKKLSDRVLLVALIALAGAFTTWTLPLILEKETLTISLSLLALMFLWLGRKLNSNFLENLAHVIYCIVFFRLLYWDIPRNFALMPKVSEPIGEYWKHMIGRLWTFGTSIASVIAGFFIQCKEIETGADMSVSEENNTPQIVSRGVTGGVFYWFAVLFVFLFAHLELNTMFMYFNEIRLPALTVLWCAMGFYFFCRCLAGDMHDKVALYAMCVFLMLAVMKVFAFDMASWHFCEGFIYNMEYNLLYAGSRLIDFGVLIAMFLTVWMVIGVKRGDRIMSSAFGYGALFLLFVYATLELNSLLYYKMVKFQKGGISILWALFAIGFISGGIWKNVTALRYLGLGLFAVVAGKVFLVDLSGMEMIYRVIAFVAVGIILLLGAFAYLYSGKNFMKGGKT